VGNIGQVQGVVSFEPLEIGGEQEPILEPVPDPTPQEPEVVGSVTGRMHISQPPLQSIPREVAPILEAVRQIEREYGAGVARDILVEALRG
jgi:hypothetical protein